MGGTFANCGAHNPIEAIMLDASVIMGPSRHNFLDIINILSPALTLVQSKREAITALKDLLSSPKKAAALVQKGQDICSEQAAILEELPEYIIEKF